MRATSAVASRRRRKRVLKAAKGYRGSRSKTFRKAHQTVMRAGVYARRDRRARKREFRRLWILRINAAARSQGLTYSAFMHRLKKAGVALDRKQLSELAIQDPKAFSALLAQVRSAG